MVYPTLILLLPAIAFALWAQSKVKSTYKKYSQMGNRRGLTGADVVQAILRDESIELTDNPQGSADGLACALEVTHGRLSDHYDPRTRTLRLSEGVYHGQSVADLGIAAHEVGHALQHARLYSPLMLRNVVYPVCNVGTVLAWPLLLIGLVAAIPPLIMLGVLLFTLSVFFTVLTLPVEFNASSRALRALSNGGYLDPEELKGAREVLFAAALTYVAAAAMAVVQLLRMVILSRGRS